MSLFIPSIRFGGVPSTSSLVFTSFAHSAAVRLRASNSKVATTRRWIAFEMHRSIFRFHVRSVGVERDITTTLGQYIRSVQSINVYHGTLKRNIAEQSRQCFGTLEGSRLPVAELFQSEAENKKCAKEAEDALLRGRCVMPPCGDLMTFEPLRPELKVELKRPVDNWAAGDIFLVVDATLPLDCA